MTIISFRVIKDAIEYDAVLERISQIFDASVGTPEGDELKALLHMVDAYQKRNGSLPDVEPVEVIKFMMRQQGLTLEDIAAHLGGEEMASLIMNGKESLTPQMIKNLSEVLHIPIETLV